MRRFVFPLESVLKLRRIQEDAASRDFAAARSRRQHEESLLAELRRLWMETACKLRAAALDSSVERMAVLGARLEHLQRDIAASQQRLQQLRRQEAEQRLRLLEARRQRGVVERLRERQEEAFKTLQRRREQRAQDEITTIRHHRKAA